MVLGPLKESFDSFPKRQVQAFKRQGTNRGICPCCLGYRQHCVFLFEALRRICKNCLKLQDFLRDTLELFVSVSCKKNSNNTSLASLRNRVLGSPLSYCRTSKSRTCFKGACWQCCCRHQSMLRGLLHSHPLPFGIRLGKLSSSYRAV